MTFKAPFLGNLLLPVPVQETSSLLFTNHDADHSCARSNRGQSGRKALDHRQTIARAYDVRHHFWWFARG